MNDSRPPSQCGRHRTYVRRRGRMTRAQARALDALAAPYCLAQSPEQWDLAQLFGRDAPVGLEVGFGMGQALVDWARERPDWNLLGIEVYQPGIGSALLGLQREELGNVRIVEAPAEQVLEDNIPPGSLAEVRVFFPDPWPKKRHHKRRLVNAAFADLVASRLRPGGLLWVATDWEAYAHWIVDVLDAADALERERAPQVTGDTGTGEEADPEGRDRPATRFEARGLALGHRVWDLRYQRKR